MYLTWAGAGDSGRVDHVTACGLPGRRPAPGPAPITPLVSAVPGRPAYRLRGGPRPPGFRKMARRIVTGIPAVRHEVAGQRAGSGGLDFLGRPQLVANDTTLRFSRGGYAWERAAAPYLAGEELHRDIGVRPPGARRWASVTPRRCPDLP